MMRDGSRTVGGRNIRSDTSGERQEGIGPNLLQGCRESDVYDADTRATPGRERDLKITFPAETIFSADEFRRYGILWMPTTVFITADGKILRKYTGTLTRDQMDAFVRELLKAPGSSCRGRSSKRCG